MVPVPLSTKSRTSNDSAAGQSTAASNDGEANGSITEVSTIRMLDVVFSDFASRISARVRAHSG